MSSKIQYISMPGARESQTANFLSRLSDRNAHDERSSKSDALAEKRFQLQLSRQNMLDKRYEQERADDKADKLANLQMQSDALLPIDVDFTTTKEVEDRDNVIGKEYDNESIIENADFIPDVNAFTPKKITDEEQALYDSVQKIKRKGLSPDEEELAIRNLVPIEKRSKDLTGVESILKPSVPYGIELLQRWKKDFENLSTTDEEKLKEKIAKNKKLGPDGKPTGDSYTDLMKRISRISKTVDSNKLGVETQQKEQRAYDKWLKQFSKDKYGKKSIKVPKDINASQKAVIRRVNEEISALPKNLTPLERARMVLGIRTRGSKALATQQKRLDARTALESLIDKENRKYARDIKKIHSTAAEKRRTQQEKAALNREKDNSIIAKNNSTAALNKSKKKTEDNK